MRFRLTRVSGFRKPVTDRWARKHLAASAVVVSDGLRAFRGVAEAGCVLESQVTGGGPESCQEPNFRWVNTILGNVKNSIHGTYHSVREKHLYSLSGGIRLSVQPTILNSSANLNGYEINSGSVYLGSTPSPPAKLSGIP